MSRAKRSNYAFYALMVVVAIVAIYVTLFLDQPAKQDDTITIESKPSEPGNIIIKSNQAEAVANESSGSGHISGILKGPVVINITQLPE